MSTTTGIETALAILRPLVESGGLADPQCNALAVAIHALALDRDLLAQTQRNLTQAQSTAHIHQQSCYDAWILVGMCDFLLQRITERLPVADARRQAQTLRDRIAEACGKKLTTRKKRCATQS